MMSQNRQQGIDRKAVENNDRISVRRNSRVAESIDQLREREVLKLAEAARMLTELPGAVDVECTQARSGRRTVVITSSYRLHGVTSFLIRRA